MLGKEKFIEATSNFYHYVVANEKKGNTTIKNNSKDQQVYLWGNGTSLPPKRKLIPLVSH